MIFLFLRVVIPAQYQENPFIYSATKMTKPAHSSPMHRFCLNWTVVPKKTKKDTLSYPLRRNVFMLLMYSLLQTGQVLIQILKHVRCQLETTIVLPMALFQIR